MDDRTKDLDCCPGNSTERISLQEFADRHIRPELRQTLKTAQEVIDAHDWKDVDAPVCCGEMVQVETWIGSPYHAECRMCEKWADSPDGPMFSNGGGCVQTLDSSKVDFDTPNRWVIGVGKPEVSA